MVTYYAALAIETDIMITFGLEDLGMGLFLCGANLLVFGFVLGLGWQRFRRERLAAEKKKSKAEKRESAVGFSSQKFKTTFDAINHSSVPASHVMLFYCKSWEFSQLLLAFFSPFRCFKDSECSHVSLFRS